MTAALIAVAVAVLAWPVPRASHRRLIGLVDAARLADERLTHGLVDPARLADERLAHGRLPGLVGAARPTPAAGAAGSELRWPAAAVPSQSRAAVPWRSRAVICAAAFALGGLGSAWRGPVVGVAAAVAGALSVSSVVRGSRRAAERSRDHDLSAALRLARAELDVGSSGAVALSAAASVAGVHRAAFEAAAAALAEGGDDVVAAVSAAGAEPELIVSAQAWQLAATLGLPLAGVLARVDDDVQARRDQVRVVASALAGPRSSAGLLAGLPVLGVVLGMAMGARPLHVLLDAAGGQMLLCAGVLLDAAGVVWTARLISSAERP